MSVTGLNRCFSVQPANTIPQWANYILIGIGVLLVIILVAAS